MSMKHFIMHIFFSDPCRANLHMPDVWLKVLLFYDNAAHMHLESLQEGTGIMLESWETRLVAHLKSQKL